MFRRIPAANGAQHKVSKFMTQIPELLTVADFCSRYSIGRTSLYREVNAGRLRLRKFGSATRIARKDALSCSQMA